MKRIRTFSLLLAVALIATASLASAEDKPSSYVMLKGGIYSPSMSYDVHDFNAGQTDRLDGKSGFAGEIGVGHYFLPLLAVELGAGYFESKGSPAAQPGEARLKVVPVVATAKLLLPLGMFEPYGLAGIGAYITDLDVNGTTGNFRGTTKITYGLHAGVGFNINFANNVFAGLEGKYLWARPSYGGQDIKLDGFVATVDVGVRF